MQFELGFNEDEDADEVAAQCCAKHGLPDEYRPQIAEYVMMMGQLS